MLTIEYNPCADGGSIPDARIEEAVHNVLTDYFDKGIEKHVVTANELVVTRFRLAVMRGDIAPCDIQFMFKDEFIPVDKDGRIVHWPEGFCDYNSYLLSGLLTARVRNINPPE